MAENVAITPGIGDVVGADDISGVKYQRVKLIHGVDGTNDGDVSSSNGLPVQGTVTANLSATDNAVLDDIALNQTDASQKSQIVDGSGNVIGATSNALDVNIKSGASSGTQYTEADTDASITGTAMMWEDSGDTLRSVSSVKPLPVNIISGAGSGGTASDDDADFTAGSTAGTPAMGVYESSPTSVTDGDLGIAGITAQRRLKTSATIDASLPSGTNAIGKLSANSGVDIGDVDVISSALPTGASTAANQTTIIGHVDGIEGLLTTIDADTSAMATSLGTLDNAIAGNEMQVDVLTMPTTTVTATDLDIRNLTNVDVVTAELSAVDNAVLDTIAAKDFATQTTLAAMNAKMVSGTDIGDVTINNSTGAAAVNIQDGGNTITVDGSLTVDLGANNDVTVTNATAANLNCTEASASAIKTAVETIDNAISGSEMQVDVVASLPAGTNALGKLLPPDKDVTTHTYYTRKYYTSAGAATDGIIWSPAAGTRWHVVTMYIQVSAAATVTLEDDKSGGDDPVWKGELAANSGVVLSFTENYPMASGEDAADLTITTSAGNVYVTCVGYEI
jgi:hypothetical protein